MSNKKLYTVFFLFVTSLSERIKITIPHPQLLYNQPKLWGFFFSRKVLKMTKARVNLLYFGLPVHSALFGQFTFSSTLSSHSPLPLTLPPAPCSSHPNYYPFSSLNRFLLDNPLTWVVVTTVCLSMSPPLHCRHKLLWSTISTIPHQRCCFAFHTFIVLLSFHFPCACNRKI